MDKLYQLLKRYPEYSITFTYQIVGTPPNHGNYLKIHVKHTVESSVPGLSTDGIETIFDIAREPAIRIVLPVEKIEASKLDLILAEAEWALEEVREFIGGTVWNECLEDPIDIGPDSSAIPEGE